MNKIALITGVNGQDGSYLADFLLDKEYLVIGLVRRTSSSLKEKYKNIVHLLNNKNFILEYGDVTDFSSISRIIKTYNPDEIYNLAAQSHVGESFNSPVATLNTNINGTLNILENINILNKRIKFYQASTSEMFGDNETFQNENTILSPVSPYACSKVCAHNLTINYRKAYGIFACSGILFNHESPRRGEDFVTKKITKAAAKIKLGMQDKIHLGNIKSFRDWGYSYEYVQAMWRMLQHEIPDDYVIATGKTTSVEEFLFFTFKHAGLDVEKHLVIDKKLFRPHDVPYLLGDPSKAKEVLGWEASTTVQELAKIMFEYDYENLKGKKNE